MKPIFHIALTVALVALSVSPSFAKTADQSPAQREFIREQLASLRNTMAERPQAELQASIPEAVAALSAEGKLDQARALESMLDPVRRAQLVERADMLLNEHSENGLLLLVDMVISVVDDTADTMLYRACVDYRSTSFSCFSYWILAILTLDGEEIPVS